MTKAERYKRYSAEFKRAAILRAAEEGNTDKAVCEELGISTPKNGSRRPRFLYAMAIY